MKLKLFISVALLVVTSMIGQYKVEWASKFEFNSKLEKDPQFVMADNYNHYLLSVVNVDGMLVNNQVIVRKFDQKNQLVDTYKQEFPDKDSQILHNYFGSYEVGNDKVVVFTESYSNKTKIAAIYKIVFDKATAKFTTTVIASYPILSLSKSGDINVVRSENGNYLGVIYQKYGTKKDPEESDCIVLDGKNLNVVWQKTATFQDEFYTNERVITNSGRIVFVRSPRSYKLLNYITVIDAIGQVNKEVGEEVKLQKPVAVSIGTQDYLVAFNYPTKGVRGGDFENLMLYDLESGKILKNNKFKDFNSIKDLKEVNVRNVFLQNNEIYLFTEGKFQLGTRATTTSFGSAGFPEPIFKNGPANLILLSFTGDLLKNIKLPTDATDADVTRSFGLLNIRGSYFLNTGYASGFFTLTPASGFTTRASQVNFSYSNDPYYNTGSGIFMNQLVRYFPDNNRLVFARIHSDGQMSLVNVTDFKP